MTKGVIVGIVVALALVGFGRAQGGEAPAGERGTRSAGVEGRKEIEVVATFLPLYAFAAAVAEGSGKIGVTRLAPPEVGPHEYDPERAPYRAPFVEEMRRARAIVTLRTLSLAPRFDRLYPLARRENIYIVEIDPAASWLPDVPRLPLMAEPVDSRHGAAAEGVNPHIWLSLSHAALLVDRIGRDFAALDREDAGRYRRNAARYRRMLWKLRAAYAAKFARLDPPVIVSLTEGFPYLTADLGLEIADYILAPRSVEEIGERIEAAGAGVVLAEAPPAGAVRREIEARGARLLLLDTLEKGGTAAPDMGEDPYLSGMRRNLDALYAACGGSPTPSE